MAKGRANIYTIAKDAGVSPATVSRVLTNNARVSKEKREKVQSVIQKYGYTPNALAQGLSNSKTRSIGLMIADIYSPFYSAVATECEKAADKAGLALAAVIMLCLIAIHGAVFHVAYGWYANRYYHKTFL